MKDVGHTGRKTKKTQYWLVLMFLNTIENKIYLLRRLLQHSFLLFFINGFFLI